MLVPAALISILINDINEVIKTFLLLKWNKLVTDTKLYPFKTNKTLHLPFK